MPIPLKGQRYLAESCGSVSAVDHLMNTMWDDGRHTREGGTRILSEERVSLMGDHKCSGGLSKLTNQVSVMFYSFERA